MSDINHRISYQRRKESMIYIPRISYNKIMKIAVASMGNEVSGHFGHCENFNIYKVEDNKIVSEEFVLSPGHEKGLLPKFLNEHEVKTIISGGIGKGAIDLFNEYGIEVITGASGNAKEAACGAITGTLKSTGSVCHNHEHAHECGEHKH